ncbi:MAG: isoprenylcysteine carboxylmethyltransferase family protein [Novosphingobium sp.]
MKIAPSTWLRPAVLDRAEQVVIALLWVWLVQRVVVSFNHDAWLLLIAETSIMVFTIMRRPTNAISMRLGDWMLAVTATAAPMLIQPGFDMLPGLRPMGMALVLAGNVVHIGAKLSLRRSFGIAPANRGVKVNFFYSFVRHPMYAGYLLVHLGIMILMPLPLNAVIYAIGWWAQILRLKAEENLLGQDPAYAEYMQKVRWRLIPGVF